MAKSVFREWPALLAVVLLGACSPSTGGRAGSAGTGGTGGSSTNSDGDAAAAPDGTAPGADGFGGRRNGVAACTAANTLLAPGNGLIADFMAAGPAGIEIGGTVGVSELGIEMPTATTTGGVLHVVENVRAPAAYPAAEVVILFDRCIDATNFAGLQFSINGTASPCTVLFAPMDSGHIDSAIGGSGPATSQPNFVNLAPTQFGPTVRIPFTGPGAPTTGLPNTPVDRAKLVGVEWVFDLSRSPTVTTGTACMADLSIDNVRFYP
jgi:hypothetical protein